MEKYRYSDEEQSFMENSPIPFAVFQLIGKKVFTISLSKGFFDLFGYSGMTKEEVYDLMDNDRYRDIHPDDLPTLKDAGFRFAMEDAPFDIIYRSRKNGEYRIIHSYGKHVYKNDGIKLAFLWYTDQGPYIDAVKNKKGNLLDTLKEQLDERSANVKVIHDYLTGLPSMSYFFKLAEAGCREIRSTGQKPVILFMDFNGMKVFNQKYGMEEGDRFLIRFADSLIALFGSEKCSRFTADHFCAFCDEEKAQENIQKLLDANNAMDIDRKMPLRIGMYLYEDTLVSISGACDRAKIACDSGRKNYAAGLYPFDPKMIINIESRQYLVENIDKALKDGWIHVYYQPIIRTTNGRVCYEECLARWEDPKKGLLSPADFVPALEEYKVIYKVDLYVVDCALKKMQHQKEQGLYVVPMSVNLSRSDFYTCDLVEEIRRRVDASGFSRDKLILEITENVVSDDIDFMIKEIRRFKDLGFRVWMDDYGSGNSSPTLLQRAPFDLIKLDMLFIRQLDDGEKSKIILTEIVRMSMALGMNTIAEGIETKEQAEFLNSIGCTMLQGFYFCKPISYEELLKRYEQGKQIGFENPDEAEYYTQLGNVNLYNLSMSNRDAGRNDYFDTWPMVMVECQSEWISIVKSNITFKKYARDHFPLLNEKLEFDANDYLEQSGNRSLKAVLRCARNGKRVILDDITEKDRIIQLFIWRVAVNPVTNAAAVMIAILSSVEARNQDAKTSPEYKKISGEYVRLQKENEKLKKEADANRKIAELKKSVSSLLTNMPAMTFSKDVHTRRYLACNQAFADYANRKTPEDVVGLTDFEIFDEETAYHFIEDDKKALAMDRPYIFYENVLDAAGNPRQFQTTKLKFTDDIGRECLLGLCQDVTDAMRIKREYVEKLAKVQSKAEIDALTGVKNKNAYKEIEALMNQKIMEKQLLKFAIIFLDVNDLKQINDTLGHEAGDKAIRDACEVICKTFKRSPVFRIGGDEFVVISQDEDYDNTDELVNAIANYNEKAILQGGITVACGMAKYDGDDCVLAVFNRADQAMYENKRTLKMLKEKSE